MTHDPDFADSVPYVEEANNPALNASYGFRHRTEGKVAFLFRVVEDIPADAEPRPRLGMEGWIAAPPFDHSLVRNDFALVSFFEQKAGKIERLHRADGSPEDLIYINHGETTLENFRWFVQAEATRKFFELAESRNQTTQSAPASDPAPPVENPGSGLLTPPSGIKLPGKVLWQEKQ